MRYLCIFIAVATVSLVLQLSWVHYYLNKRTNVSYLWMNLESVTTSKLLTEHTVSLVITEHQAIKLIPLFWHFRCLLLIHRSFNMLAINIILYIASWTFIKNPSQNYQRSILYPTILAKSHSYLCPGALIITHIFLSYKVANLSSWLYYMIL